ncbi:phage tail protein [Delftia acidovorans]|uniref:phage tail protein n=1 Tax=Delftia acidovorans TaxID=80866 RepID=UPI0035A14B71
MDAFIGEIRQFPFNFAPKNWALCNGQLLAIQSNPALFSIIGTFYGGNGTTTFGLPNLIGHVVTGADPQQSWNIGSTEGTDSVTLLTTEMPQHNHLLTGLNNPGTQAAPDSTSYLTFDGRGGYWGRAVHANQRHAQRRHGSQHADSGRRQHRA